MTEEVYTQFEGETCYGRLLLRKQGARGFMAFDRHRSLSEDRLLREYSSELMTVVVFI